MYSYHVASLTFMRISFGWNTLYMLHARIFNCQKRHTDIFDHFVETPWSPVTKPTTLAHKSHKQHSDFSRMIFVPSVKQLKINKKKNRKFKTKNSMRRFVGCKRLQKQISKYGIRKHIKVDNNKKNKKIKIVYEYKYKTEPHCAWWAIKMSIKIKMRMRIQWDDCWVITCIFWHWFVMFVPFVAHAFATMQWFLCCHQICSTTIHCFHIDSDGGSKGTRNYISPT